MGYITRQELRLVKPPEATETWKPVAHYDLLMAIEKALKSQKLSVHSEEISCQRKGQYFFCILDLKRDYGSKFPQSAGILPSLGIMASNNKKIGIQISIGARVISCNNPMFAGNTVIYSRKHTQSLRIEDELDEMLSVFAQYFKDLCLEVTALQRKEISESQACVIMLKSFVEGILPVRLIRLVYMNYFNPEIKEFKKRTLWSLYNAFTNAADTLTLERKFTALRDISMKFQRI